jgi:hypothetical protein
MNAPLLAPASAPPTAAEHLRSLLLAALALPPLFMMSLSRFDVVGFAFFLLAAAMAVVSLKGKSGLLGVRIAPLLGLLAVIGYCGDVNRGAVDDAQAAGPALVAACQSAGTCPAVPAGFTEVAGAVLQQQRGGRVTLSYHRKDDGRSFRLRVTGPLSSTWWVGGVDEAFRSAEVVGPPGALEKAVAPPAP